MVQGRFPRRGQENLTLLLRQLVQERLVQHEHVSDEAVIAYCHVLLHFEEAHRGDRNDRIFLPVDHLLLKRAVELSEADRGRDGAERLELLLDHRRRHRPDLMALVVRGRTDREIPRELLEPALPESNADDVDLLQGLQDRRARRTVKHRISRSPIGEQERQV